LNDGPGDLLVVDVQPSIDVLHDDDQCTVGQDPGSNQAGTEGLVIVVQSRLLYDLGGLNLLEGASDGLFEGCVNVLLEFGGILDGTDTGTEIGLGLDRGKSIGLVATFGTPRNLERIVLALVALRAAKVHTSCKLHIA
jgi:hypothetical protein